LANETATLGKTGKFGDLKRRLMFLLGALILAAVALNRARAVRAEAS